MGVAATIPSTFDTPMLAAGPASVVWTWLVGSIFCMSIALSIAEIISAYPISGGLYTASKFVVPKEQVPIVAWVVGWLNTLGQIAGFASTDFACARMVAATAYLITDGAYVATPGAIVGIYVAILVLHGIINTSSTKFMAVMTKYFVFINFGTAIACIVALFATVPESQKLPINDIFFSVTDATGWNSNALAIMFGLLSVCWTMTDYDATGHIAEETHRASIRGPVSIIAAVTGTGILGLILNIAFVACSNGIALPGGTGMSTVEILYNNVGKNGTIVLLILIILVTNTIGISALQANSRMVFAFARDGGLPFSGFFAKMNAKLQVPVNSVWIIIFISMLMGLLNLASATAVNAIFSLATVAMDWSYSITILYKIYYCHIRKSIQFVPGPFNMGPTLGLIINVIAVVWTAFVSIILVLPPSVPVTTDTMNYAGPITVGVMFLSMIWYYVDARKWYMGPLGNLSTTEASLSVPDEKTENKDAAFVSA
ncbi:amino acid permease [Rhizoclosmatium globosum]|uniref:Amino acid permease n=1 Tax=Rhizoclosmatium globosum TaxID=329046 RepID=A0A1Y2B1F1_9FUNG|nr:amino acid permease [Rhizoclosmatium globosum]|eukprot:ORY28380.1 amino acid permease [Rhizoclosmatium globosum]